MNRRLFGRLLSGIAIAPSVLANLAPSRIRRWVSAKKWGASYAVVKPGVINAERIDGRLCVNPADLCEFVDSDARREIETMIQGAVEDLKLEKRA